MAHLTWQDVEAMGCEDEAQAEAAFFRAVWPWPITPPTKPDGVRRWMQYADATKARIEIVSTVARDLHTLALNARQAGATEQAIQRGAQPYVNALAALLSVTSAEFWLENAGAGLVILEQTLEL